MAGTPETIVLDPAKTQLERAEATQIRAKMLQESLGSVGKNVMDIVTQYEDLKSQKQKQDLASMTMAGTLSGGMDKLPQDAKNKLPGILGVSLPTDDQGNVQITPDTDTVIKRMTLNLLQNDPNAQRIFVGLRQKETDPNKLANDLEMQKVKDAGDRERDAAANARNQATNATNIDKALIESRSRIEAAHIGADAKGAADKAPSPFVLDPSDNTMVTEPQWYTKHPGEQIPNFLSHKDAETINKTINTNSAVEARNSSIAANKARIASLDTRMKQMMANEPQTLLDKQTKHLMDLVKLTKGTTMQDETTNVVNREFPKILKQMGYSDNDITSMTTAAGGSWFWRMFDWRSSADGTTAVDSQPSLRQPSTDHIHGVSTDVPAPAGATSTPTTGGTTYAGDDAKKYLGIQ